MKKGTIAFLGKGFGFLKVEGQAKDSKDLFFHCTELKDSNFNDISVGDTLYFESVDQTNRGDSAKGVYVNEQE